jgi:hypothetical protein
MMPLLPFSKTLLALAFRAESDETKDSYQRAVRRQSQTATLQSVRESPSNLLSVL